MQLGVDGVFVGSGIFKSSNPPVRAQAMAQAVTHYKEPALLAEISSGLGEAMFGTPASDLKKRLAGVPSEKQEIWNATLGVK